MKIDFVMGDDWEGCYINDQLEIQGHRLEADDVAKAISALLPRLNITVASHEADMNWLGDVGQLPNSFNKVKFENV